MRKYFFAIILCLSLILTASCGAAPDHPFEFVPNILPAIPDEETFVYESNDFSIIINVIPMLPFHFFGYNEGFFQVCYDAGYHSEHNHSCRNVGFIDPSGNVVIALGYRLGGLFSEGLVILINGEYRSAIANANGEFLTRFEYTYIHPFNTDGLAIAAKPDYETYGVLHGIINRNMETVLPFEKRDLLITLTDLTDNIILFAIYDDSSTKYGMMDINGEIIIPAQYPSQYEFMWADAEERLIYVQTGGLPTFSNRNRRIGVYDFEGNLVIPATLNYMHVNNFRGGLASVMRITDDYIFFPEWNFNQPVSVFGYIDKTGELVIPMLYNTAQNFVGGLALVGIYEDTNIDDTMLYGFIDTEGNEVVPVIYADAKEFSDGLAAVGLKTEDGIAYGYVNRYGEVVIPLEYQLANSFNNGVAWVKRNLMWGMIDTTGNEIIPPKYQMFWILSDEYTAVRYDEMLGVVNVSGKVVVPYVYDSIHELSDGFIVVEKYNENGMKYGLINTKGEVIVPFEYDEIQRFGDYIIVNVEGLRGIWQIIRH